MNNDSLSFVVGEAFECGYLRLISEEYWDDFDEFFLARSNMTLAQRNEYYRETLDWERAPAPRIDEWESETSRWKPRCASELSDAQVSVELLSVAKRLYKLNHLICRADHLSDRRLYNLIVKCVLPCNVKRLKRPRRFCCWDFCSFAEDAQIPAPSETLEESNALAYYATDKERFDWAAENGCEPPTKMPIKRRDFFPFDVDPDLTPF